MLALLIAAFLVAFGAGIVFGLAIVACRTELAAARDLASTISIEPRRRLAVMP